MKQIPLTQGQYAIVDDEDYEWLSQYRWCARWRHTKSFYAERGVQLLDGGYTNQSMHRVLMGDPRDENGKAIQVDHINQYTLDNRRSNLRVDYNKQNVQNRGISSTNTSGYKGVSRHNGGCKWKAQIRVKGELIYLGLFTSKHEAAKAYNQAALKYHGEYACLNDIVEEPTEDP